MKYRNTLLSCLFLFLLFPTKASAEAISLKIQPTVLQIKATPPADIEAPFSIENRGETPLELKIVLKRFRGDGMDGGNIQYSNPHLKNDQEADTFLKQIEIRDGEATITSITLSPKQRKELELHIPVSKDTSKQDHYFSLLFLTEPPEADELDDDASKENTFSLLTTAVGLPVLLSVEQNDQKASGILETFSAPLVLQAGPVPFTVRVENTGEHFITAKGAILIKNMFGQTVGRVNLPATNVLAESTRLLASEGTDMTTKTMWSEKFLLGFYTATLSLAISPDQSLYTRSVHFITFPLSFLISLLLALGIALIVFRRVKKRISEE